MTGNSYTRKQMGDACEMLVAAELTLAGIPATKLPDNWPGYDLIAQLHGVDQLQRISVKSRSLNSSSDAFVYYDTADEFDWLAVVLVEGKTPSNRRIFIFPRSTADQCSRGGIQSKNPSERRITRKQIEQTLIRFENNFALSKQ
jgi:hypothetical protein